MLAVVSRILGLGIPEGQLPRPEPENLLGIGTSLLLIATGAILRWAITANVEGVDLDVVGLILLRVR